MASASMVISTRSPTTIPPRSNCAFQLTPKSCRFIVVVAVKPARVLGPLRGGQGPQDARRLHGHDPDIPCRYIVVVGVKPASAVGPLSTPLSHQGVCHSPR